MRNIIWSESFSKGVDFLGGAEAIDEALEPLMDGLSRNPYGFPKLENDWISFRYARTKAIPYRAPALVFAFTIDEKRDVILQWVEEDIPL